MKATEQPFHVMLFTTWCCLQQIYCLPVANLLTISEAGSTSEMSKGFLANLICSCPRSVQERTYSIQDMAKQSAKACLLTDTQSKAD